MTCTEKAIQFMENTANNDTHGYSQRNRWGNPDYDCSSLVITAWETAGVKVKSAGASYTGNMLSVFLKCGFEDVTSKVHLSNGCGLLRGDVLLHVGKHTAMYCGYGLEVEASIDEKGGVKGETKGDNTGYEIHIRKYRNYPWTHVLRYKEVGTGQQATGTGQQAKAVNDSLINDILSGKWGKGANRKERLTNAGYDYEAVQKAVNARCNHKSESEIAREVIAGKWGNGVERMNALKSAGYDYNTIQTIVKDMLAD